MFRSRIRRVWGHAAVFVWSDLVLDRSRKLVGLQSPAACATRAGGDSDPDFENYDLFHAQSPDTGRGLQVESQERPQGHSRTQSVFHFPSLWSKFLFCFVVMVPQLLGLGGRTRAAAAASASEASAISYVSTSHSAT